jgi:hypothetical protein
MSAHLKLSITQAITNWTQNRAQVEPGHPGAFIVSVLEAIEKNGGGKVSDLHTTVRDDGNCFVQTRADGKMTEPQLLYRFSKQDIIKSITKLSYITCLEIFCDDGHSNLPKRLNDNIFFNGRFPFPGNAFNIRFQFSPVEDNVGHASFRYIYNA